MFSLLNFSCLISIDRHPFLRHIFLCFLFYFEIITPSFPVFFSNSLSKSLFYHYVSLKIGQKLVIFRSNFCPQTTTSCGLTCLFFFFPTILHQNYRLDCFFFVPNNSLCKFTIIEYWELKSNRLYYLLILFFFIYLYVCK